MASDGDSNGWGEPSVIDREGCRIHYWAVGPADAPTVVCSHGATMDHHMFDAQREPLLDAGYRVVTWDIRGHGLSKPIGARFDVPTVVADLVAVLDRVGADEVVALGQSFGGYVSQELCFRHPERVAAVAIVGATDITQLPSKLESLALRLSPYLFGLWPYRHLRKVVADSTAKTEAAKRYAYGATGQLSKREFVAVWKGVATALHAEPGYVVEKPLLLTHGDADETGTIARDAPAWAEKEPECRYEVIPDAGHNANQDNPEFFNRVLLEFLEEHVPARTDRSVR
ncbi:MULTISPECIES: alpha/beta fold hydrolase [Halorussus]|uniref:alpha/beta fold hydrolase n=1 Tax=Halorussus TaxID=1070314 RepID=UPI00209DAD79|nr:alpha/beta hydrolase [Halorussus vallis]USZ74980.1 alpha/beta hydrolase [Halorussus vallis]